MGAQKFHVYTQFIGRNVLDAQHWFGIELFDLNTIWHFWCEQLTTSSAAGEWWLLNRHCDQLNKFDVCTGTTHEIRSFEAKETRMHSEAEMCRKNDANTSSSIEFHRQRCEHLCSSMVQPIHVCAVQCALVQPLHIQSAYYINRKVDARASNSGQKSNMFSFATKLCFVTAFQGLWNKGHRIAII